MFTIITTIHYISCVRLPCIMPVTSSSSSTTPYSTAIFATTTNTTSASATAFTFTKTTGKLYTFCIVKTVRHFTITFECYNQQHVREKKFQSFRSCYTLLIFFFCGSRPFCPTHICVSNTYHSHVWNICVHVLRYLNSCLEFKTI